MTRPQGAHCFRVIVRELLWGVRMLISNNVLSKWNVALSLLLVPLQCFRLLSSLSDGDVVPRLHLCLITSPDGSVTGFSLLQLSLFCSLKLLPTYIYLQQQRPALASSFCSSYCTPFTAMISAVSSRCFCHCRQSTRRLCQLSGDCNEFLLDWSNLSWKQPCFNTDLYFSAPVALSFLCNPDT